MIRLFIIGGIFLNVVAACAQTIDPSIGNLLQEKSYSYNTLIGLDKNQPYFSFVDKDGETFLMKALRSNGVNAFGLLHLLSKETDFSRKNKAAETYLIATGKGELDDAYVIDFLVEKGADPNAVDAKGKTALMYACEATQPALKKIESLIGWTSKTALSLKNSDGKTAFDLCLGKQNNWHENVKIKIQQAFEKKEIAFFDTIDPVPELEKPDLFTNISRPQKDDPLFDSKMDVFSQIAFLNYVTKRKDFILDASDKKDVVLTKQAIAQYSDALKQGIPQKEAFEASFGTKSVIWSNACVGCIVDTFIKNWQSLGIYPFNSKQCLNLQKSDKYRRNPADITYNFNGKTYAFKTTYEGSGQFPMATVTLLEKGGEKEIPVHSPIFWRRSVGYFELDGRLYYVDTDYENEQFDLFEFIPQDRYFKEVCSISEKNNAFKVTALEGTPLCQKISDGNYKTLKDVPLVHSIGFDGYEELRKNACRAEVYPSLVNKPNFSIKSQKESLLNQCLSNPEKSRISLFGDGTITPTGVVVDYDDDGKKDVLIKASFDDPHCVFSFYYAYDLEQKSFKMVPTGEANASFHPGKAQGPYKLSCEDSSQDLVEVDGKTYVLTYEDGTPVSLTPVMPKENKTNNFETLCTFRVVS